MPLQNINSIVLNRQAGGALTEAEVLEVAGVLQQELQGVEVNACACQVQPGQSSGLLQLPKAQVVHFGAVGHA